MSGGCVDFGTFCGMSEDLTGGRRGYGKRLRRRRKRGEGVKFEAGQSGNPVGRPKGSYGGRIMALAGLDKLLARKKNQRALITALEKDLQANPVRFFRTVIMPLLPRESKLSFDHEGVIQWRSLVGSAETGNLKLESGRTMEREIAQDDFVRTIEREGSDKTIH
jgi:hypothetical protein